MLEQKARDLGSPGRILDLKYSKNAQNYLELCLLSILIFFSGDIYAHIFTSAISGPFNEYFRDFDATCWQTKCNIYMQ